MVSSPQAGQHDWQGFLHHAGGCSRKLPGQCGAFAVDRFRCKRKFKAIRRNRIRREDPAQVGGHRVMGSRLDRASGDAMGVWGECLFCILPSTFWFFSVTKRTLP